jgi:hypothetical protein
LNFICVCFLLAPLFGGLWYSAFKITISVQSDTIQAYKNRYGTLSNSEYGVDLAKLFVSQPVTNLFDGNRIILNYDPIPQTVKVIVNGPDRTVDLRGYSLNGTTILFTNQPSINTINSLFKDSGPGWSLTVEYVKNSAH